MGDTAIVLRTDRLQVKIAPPGTDYNGSRYDWSSIVTQVTLDGCHTFFSGEHYAGGSTGMGGRGLAGCIEWDTTELYDEVDLADSFPMLGIGLVKKGDTLPFQFNKAYAVTAPFPRTVQTTDSSCTIITNPILSNGIAVEQMKAYTLDGNTLTVRNTFRNVGSRSIHAKEFVHNFFCFDGHPIDRSYCLTLPFSVQPRFRRGELAVGCQTLRPYTFDGPTDSTAAFVDGWQGLRSHTMRLENRETGTAVIVKEDFPPCHFYFWSNPSAFCPEVFCKIDLEPGETIEYTRKYTFATI